MMPARLLVFFVVLTFALTGLVRYVTRRTAEAAGLSERGRKLLFAVTLGAVLGPVLLRFTGGFAQGAIGGALALVGFGISLTTIIAAALLAPFDLLRAAIRKVRAWRTRGHRGAPPAPAATPQGALALAVAAPAPDAPLVRADDLNAGARASEGALPVPTAAPEGPPAEGPAPGTALLTRRDALARVYAGACVGVGAATSFHGIVVGRHDYVLEDVPVPLQKLPRSLDGYTIAQLSDLHVGTFVGDREFEAAIALVRRARPDLVVLTGDLVDHDISYAPQLGRFVRALVELGVRDGVAVIPGNHDYYAGADRVLSTVRAAGADVLRNRGRVIGEAGAAFALLGVDDVWAARDGLSEGPNLARALADLPEGDLARVLLCHNPEFYPEAAGHVDLQLSGHTHGGQVNFVVRPADYVLRHGYIQGHYHRGASQLYVNRGFGTAGPPARVGAPPEVSRIVLTSV